MSSLEITYEEYWKEIGQVARDIFEELEIKTLDDFEANHSEIGDRLFEAVDGHEWIIYTWANKEILKQTRNESYSEDNFGTDGYEGKTYDEIGLQIAFWAFYADIQDELTDLQTELEAVA